MTPSPKAVLDLGTNSTRFLAMSPDAHGFDPDSILDRDTRITRLGEGLDQSGTLSRGAIDRVLERVHEYNRRIQKLGGEWIGGVATSACRRASNGEVLLEKVKEITGVVPEVVSGESEARLIFRGAHSSLPDLSTGRIMDIGGGSTEWITFQSDEYNSLESLEVGVVTLLERCVDGEALTHQSLDRTREMIRSRLPARKGEGDLVVVGGTGATLAAYHMDLNEYRPAEVHAHRLSLSDVRSIRREFQDMSMDALAREPMIQDGREDVIIPGILILEEFAEYVGRDQFVVSEYGILAGLLEERIRDSLN